MGAHLHLCSPLQLEGLLAGGLLLERMLPQALQQQQQQDSGGSAGGYAGVGPNPCSALPTVNMPLSASATSCVPPSTRSKAVTGDMQLC